MSKYHIRGTISLIILWFMWVEPSDEAWGEEFSTFRIISNILNHLMDVYKAQVFMSVHWKGDHMVATRLAFTFQRMKLPKLKEVHWRPLSPGRSSLTLTV